MATVLRQRVAEIGAGLELLVLVSEPDGCIGVDLASGALVRAHHPPTDGRVLRPFSIAQGQLGPPDMDDVCEPERAELTGPLQPTARLHPRKADRLLRPLLHPNRPPLLGQTASVIPYWTLQGDHPSVTLIDPTHVGVALVGAGYVCRFLWLETFHELKLHDRRLVGALRRGQVQRCAGRDLERYLGHPPERLVVALTPPADGYCYKVVKAILPRR